MAPKNCFEKLVLQVEALKKVETNFAGQIKSTFTEPHTKLYIH